MLLILLIAYLQAKEAQALAMGAKHLLVSSDEEAMKQAANTFDGIIDTVSAKHDLNQELALLAPHGKLILVRVGAAAVNNNVWMTC